MKVVFTEEALQNIDEILAYTSNHYPAAYGALVVRLPSVIARVAEWPDSAQEVKERPGVRVVPLVRYPYKVLPEDGRDHRGPLRPSRCARRTAWMIVFSIRCATGQSSPAAYAIFA